MADVDTVEVPFSDHAVKCPFCNETLQFTVTVGVMGGFVRRTGTVGMDQHYTIDLNRKVQSAEVAHKCSGPKTGE